MVIGEWKIVTGEWKTVTGNQKIGESIRHSSNFP